MRYLLSLCLFLITGCSEGTSGDISVSPPNPEPGEYSLSWVTALITEAYSGEIFLEPIYYGSGRNLDSLDTMSNSLNDIFANSKWIPATVMTYLESHTGANLVGRIPFYDASLEKIGYELFVADGTGMLLRTWYCAAPKFPRHERWFPEIQRTGFSCFSLTPEKSIALRLSRILGTQKNRYFHAEYAMKLSDWRVASLDPLDTDITDTWALFYRMNLPYKPDLQEFTKLIHDRYYLTGGLIRLDDPTKVPTKIENGNVVPWGDRSQVFYDSYEVQRFDEKGYPKGSDIYIHGYMYHIGSEWLASYASKSISWGTYTISAFWSPIFWTEQENTYHRDIDGTRILPKRFLREGDIREYPEIDFVPQ